MQQGRLETAFHSCKYLLGHPVHVRVYAMYLSPAQPFYRVSSRMIHHIKRSASDLWFSPTQSSVIMHEPPYRKGRCWD
ncbi:hypothetical protein GGTG_02642 [Gaeumannomyces tritici R3-111a-1]|uniref:Uncharacterized protein n=1 Tax=Gaeumannomyces tritici (strain R3-111a-1) TaxID=644352 RepID=J3NMY3_GAET3|nr:hypothetical protein GGTG_02642 [Gaeumannomyces tritici R3-111a-1]EJT77535.1 hypothetical protein GGTG_02642 [Gaeumannomyces tritici R3-111a-1]